MKIRQINKRADIGLTITWFVAVVIIFFVMLVFVSTAFALSGKKALPLIGTGKNKITLADEGYAGEDVQRKVISFLNLPVNVSGQQITIHALIDSSSLEDKSSAGIFKENAEKIFSEEFTKHEGGVIPWWIRVYGIEEKMGITFYGNFKAGAYNCDPNKPEESIVSSIIIGDKKVVFCITKTYYFDVI